ncbi:unnamed protein product, partial [Ectocarpus sp. 12 AP-2014]
TTKNKLSKRTNAREVVHSDTTSPPHPYEDRERGRDRPTNEVQTLVDKKRGGVRSSFEKLSNEKHAHPTTLPPPSGGESCPPYYFDLRRRQHPPSVPRVFLLAAALSYMHSNHIEQQPWTVLNTA